MSKSTEPQVGIIMGSQSDWETMKNAADTLDTLGVCYETKIVSAHRTPKRLYEYAESAKGRGLRLSSLVPEVQHTFQVWRQP
jgi:5-(carboxyamino)imidazole ribonucleotide mutase